MRIGIRVIAFFMATLLIASLGGCIAVDVGIGGATGPVRAEGAVVTREIPVGAFSQIELLSAVDLIYKSGDSGVTLATHENFFEHITFEVKGDILYVSSQKHLVHELGGRPVLTVTAPSLSALYVAGSAEMADSDPIKGDSFYLEIVGSADIALSLDVSSLNVVATGSAELDFSGTADDVAVQISGSAEIDALELSAKRVHTRIDGAGDITISCSERLEASISGSGTVAYRGDPEIVRRISGAGDVRQIS